LDSLVYIGLGMVMGLLGRAILPPPQHLGPTSAMLGGLVGGFAGGMIGDRHLGGAALSLDGTGLILSVVGALIAVAVLSALGRGRAHA
jgi:uncharacterized membrane protein YeaQ/YmgE (transglycosylase-associated protein family)